MLLEESEEFGISEGLGVIPGRVIPIPKLSTNRQKLKVPHIGWSELVPTLENNFGQTGYLKDFKNLLTFTLFTLTWQVQRSPQDILSETIYGGHRIPAIIGKGNVIGCQFHPEKSGKAGIDLIQRFINWKQS